MIWFLSKKKNAGSSGGAGRRSDSASDGDPWSGHHKYQDLYGVSSIREKKIIDMTLELVEWDPQHEYDRLGVDDRRTEILGVEIPHIIIPVRQDPQSWFNNRSRRQELSVEWAITQPVIFRNVLWPAWKSGNLEMRWSNDENHYYHRHVGLWQIHRSKSIGR